MAAHEAAGLGGHAADRVAVLGDEVRRGLDDLLERRLAVPRVRRLRRAVHGVLDVLVAVDQRLLEGAVVDDEVAGEVDVAADDRGRAERRRAHRHDAVARVVELELGLDLVAVGLPGPRRLVRALGRRRRLLLEVGPELARRAVALVDLVEDGVAREAVVGVGLEPVAELVVLDGVEQIVARLVLELDLHGLPADVVAALERLHGPPPADARLLQRDVDAVVALLEGRPLDDDAVPQGQLEVVALLVVEREDLERLRVEEDLDLVHGLLDARLPEEALVVALLLPELRAPVDVEVELRVVLAPEERRPVHGPVVRGGAPGDEKHRQAPRAKGHGAARGAVNAAGRGRGLRVDRPAPLERNAAWLSSFGAARSAANSEDGGET